MVEIKETWGSDEFISEVAASTRGKDSMAHLQKGLSYMWHKGHTSPFEFAGATFYVRCSIVAARHWMRHRIFSYNELSRRVTTLEDFSVGDFYFPYQEGSQYSIYKDTYEASFVAYQRLLQEGVKPEEARYVLPQGTMTQFYVSGNLHSWMHFLTLRTSEAAQEEIRAEAKNVEDILDNHFVNTLYAWKEAVG